MIIIIIMIIILIITIKKKQKKHPRMQLVARELARFDIGNLVVAFTSAAKFEEGLLS